MKLKIMVLMALGVAGVGASFALAANNSSHGHKAACRRTVLVGTASVPQSFTVTLSRTWRHTNLKPGQSVNVTMGSSGQTIRFTGVGCVGDDGSVTVSVAGFQVVQHHERGGGTTTTTSTPATTTTTTTTTSF